MSISVNVLLYGEHEDLASRCLSTLANGMDYSLVKDVRIGLNAVGQKTRELLSGLSIFQCPVYLFEPIPRSKNAHKYPLMRHMLYDYRAPFTAKKVMWFDDDSYPIGKTNWWADVWAASENAVALGSIYRPGYHWNANEQEAIKRQGWYAGKPLTPPPHFITGGWWVVDYAFLRQWDYPFRELDHNGGDVLLGELCRQQDVPLTKFNAGVMINAGFTGKESGAKRRGDKTSRPFEHSPTPGTAHHDFIVCVTELY